MAEAARAGGSVSSDILSHSPLAEPVRAGGTASSDILRAAHWLSRYVPEALPHRISSRTAHWLSRYVPEARHFSVTRYATQERAGTVHLQAVSVPEVRHYPRLFRNKKVPQAMLTELFALQDGLEPTTP